MKDTILLLLLLGAVGWGYMKYQSGDFQIVRNVPPPPPVLIQDTYQPQPQAVPVPQEQQVQQTPATVTPAPVIDFQATTESYFASIPPTRPFLGDLPTMGPYTPDQLDTCRAVWEQGIQNELISPQHDLCLQYLTINGYFK